METKIIKNYLYNLSYQILMVLSPLITTPYISRVLHADGVGIYSYTFTMATAFALFAALGVNTYGQREIAYCGDDIKQRSKTFWELFIVRVITTGVVGISYIVFSFTYSQYTVYLLTQSFIVFATMIDISWLYQGIEEFKLIAVRNIIIKLITISLIFVFVKESTDLILYILINSISTFLSFFIFFVDIRKHIQKVSFSELRFQKHLKGTIEFFIPLIATQIYSQLDKIMLGAITNDAFQNGYYEQSRKIINILIMVTTSINGVMYPRISRLFANNEHDEIRKLYQSSIKMIWLLLVPMMIGIVLVSDNFVGWFFGDGYDQVAILMKLSAPLLLFMTLGNFVGMQYLIPTGKQNKMTLIYIVSAIINIILNSFFIVRLQSVGAIIASMIAEAVSCFIQLYLIKKSQYDFKLLAGAWRYMVSGLFMGAGIYLLQICSSITGILQTVIEVLVAMLIYAIGLIITKEENAFMVIGKIKTML